MKMTKADDERAAKRLHVQKHLILSLLSPGSCKHADLACVEQDRLWECSCGMKVTITTS